MSNDEELMKNYQAGDMSSFDELYGRYKGKVYGFISSRVKEHSRDEIFQRVFTRLHQKKHLYKQEYPFAPWFYTLIRNVIIDFYRERKFEYIELNEEMMWEREDEIQEFDLSILESLDEKEALLLYQKFVEGLSYKELEDKLNIKSATLRKRISRLVKKLKDNLGYN